MRMLVVSNFYPPKTIGGMEKRCKETVDQLIERGHEVVVLTSTFRKQPGDPPEANVYRDLQLEADLYHYRPLSFFLNYRRNRSRNITHLKRLLNSFHPDVVYIWGMWNLSRFIPYYLEQFWSAPVVYSLSDYWSISPNSHDAYWRLPAQHFFMKPVKMLLKIIVNQMLSKEPSASMLRFENTICGSQFVYSRLLKAGIPFNKVRVIYPGVNINKFLPKPVERRNDPNRNVQLLYAGSLFVHKGVATAIEALSILVKNRFQKGINLTILGSGPPAYQEHLKSIVAREQIEKYVRFIPQLDYEQMPDLLPNYDILILPSIYDEPFSRIVMEAMAVGLLVIGTTTGGTREILVEGETGLTFQPEDPSALAQQIEKAIAQPELWDRIIQTSMNKVREAFSIEKMVSDIENFLECVVNP